MHDDEDPGDAKHDHGRADESGVPQQLRRRDVVERIDDDRELKADEDEEERVEEVLDDLPDGDSLQTDLCRRQLRGVPAEVDAGGHGGEHGRDADQVGGDERDVPGQERDRDLGGWVVEAAPDLADQPADGEPEGDPAARADDEERSGVRPRRTTR